VVCATIGESFEAQSRHDLPPRPEWRDARLKARRSLAFPKDLREVDLGAADRDSTDIIQ